MAADQYIEDPKVPVECWAPVPARTLNPVTAVAGVAPALELPCCGCAVKPAAVSVTGCRLPWPATKTTARSPLAAGAAAPESAAVPTFEAPAATSSGFDVATPANSMTSKAMTVAVATVTVTEVVGFAFAAYQSSPSE